MENRRQFIEKALGNVVKVAGGFAAGHVIGSVKEATQARKNEDKRDEIAQLYIDQLDESRKVVSNAVSLLKEGKNDEALKILQEIAHSLPSSAK